ncbi:MAG: hypothetical protein NTW19_15065 [Planctomycetota bacterium]|nr:hypothetical protein [Planctomycetota bacterium]
MVKHLFFNKDSPMPTRDEIFAAVQALIAEKDLFAASEHVFALADEPRIVEAFSDLVADVYYKAKSVEQVIHFAHAGIHYCLARAAAKAKDNPAAANELRLDAKRMATNVASFTWPGWDEPGVAISPDQLRQGLAFARYSIRQLLELEPKVAQLAFSYWFLGAQLLANGLHAEALGPFGLALDNSRKQEKNADGVTMLEGYIGLAKLLDAKRDVGQRAAGEAEFNAAVSTLKSRGNDDAGFYAEQLVTARKVFEMAQDSG